MRILILIPILFLCGCITITPTGYTEGRDNLASLEKDKVIHVRSYAQMVGTRTYENKVKNPWESDTAVKVTDKDSTKMEDYLETGIINSLNTLGYTCVDEKSDIEAVYLLNAQSKSSSSRITLRIMIQNRISGRLYFDRTGNYKTNGKINRVTMEGIINDLLKISPIEN